MTIVLPTAIAGRVDGPLRTAFHALADRGFAGEYAMRPLLEDVPCRDVPPCGWRHRRPTGRVAISFSVWPPT